MTVRSHRLAILRQEEIDELWGQPRFDVRDRDLYFDLTPQELAVVVQRRNAVGIHFVLQLGYFHARRMFFDPSGESARQDQILELLGYRRWTGMRHALVARLSELAMRSTQPNYLLREALKFVDRERVVRPAYSALQDLVGEVMNKERDRLTMTLRKALKSPVRKVLASLLAADGTMYSIGLLKQDLRDFSYTALRQEVARRQAFAPLHAFANMFLKQVNISPESSKYYASMVMFYTVFKLRRMDPLVVQLYLLCFAFHRYRQINDHLVEAFVTRVEIYTRQARAASEQAMLETMEKSVQGLHGAGDVLEMFVDPNIMDKTRFAAVKDKAYKLLPKERFAPVADYLRDIAFDKTAHQWKAYGELSPTIKKNLRHIFAELDFAGQHSNEPLLKAVAFFQ